MIFLLYIYIYTSIYIYIYIMVIPKGIAFIVSVKRIYANIISVVHVRATYKLIYVYTDIYIVSSALLW